MTFDDNFSMAAPEGQTKRHEIEGVYCPFLVRMDDYGYLDWPNDLCFVMDDYGTAILTPWSVYFD